MKKGYKRLLIFEIIFMILFILSGFVSSILSGYVKVLLSIGILVIFYFIFGFEKDRHRYSKSICIEIIINLLIFFILYYLLGILIGFAKVGNYWTFNYVFEVIIPLILTIILKEILRYMMLVKSEGSKLLIIITTIFFIIFEVAGQVNDSIFTSPYSAFTFFAVTIIPIISANIYSSYVSYKAGYKPIILYLLIMNLYVYFVPIIPNPNEYFYSIIYLVVPMIFLYNIYRFFLKDRDEDVLREYHKKRILPLIIPTIIVIFLVYITSGYFYYHAIAIASGSMTPNINKGDVVVIEKYDNFENIEIGQVIAYKKANIIVVHRLIKKLKIDGKYYFYTKGDNNDAPDNYEITEDMFIGIVNIKVPYIGYPTVWVNSL
ncbi:MAG: signal peptidase I [Bacilli bacterium]|nr:signal peptidase I [Bacilli bacterium]